MSVRALNPIIREVPITVTEAVAGTFVDTPVPVSTYFMTSELERGVYLVGALVYISPPAAASGANQAVGGHVQITKGVGGSALTIGNAKTLYAKYLMGHAGANAACINHFDAKHYPSKNDTDGYNLIYKNKMFKVDKNAPNTDIYVGINSWGNAAVLTADLVLKFAISP